MTQSTAPPQEPATRETCPTWCTADHRYTTCHHIKVGEAHGVSVRLTRAPSGAATCVLLLILDLLGSPLFGNGITEASAGDLPILIPLMDLTGRTGLADLLRAATVLVESEVAPC
ncbi:hypothetical protein [Actinomadura rupiterrae]|uniref:hypothetical protein n=1 Tax=Actinomadura rupiterrae TaxID=559627 RepID=UPI0020A5BBE8|nr:hypothetical protein [Actinomadura rupiterrae]MCP2339232.1 hypothetical protein [Actinomadura rupiterrae]